MEVRIRIKRQVVVDGEVNSLNINTTSQDVSRNTDTLVEFFEFFEAFDTIRYISKEKIKRNVVESLPLFLAYTRVHRNTREVTLAEKLVKFIGAECALDENDDLVEFQVVQKLVQLPVLLGLVELDVVLQQTVKGQFCIIINVDLQRVLHKLLADGSNLLRQSGAKHHHLFLSRCSTENGLNITTHICTQYSSALSISKNKPTPPY